MMTRAVIFLDDETWRIVLTNAVDSDTDVIRVNGDIPEAGKADQVYEYLQQAGCLDRPVILALPSSWCAAGTVSLDDLPRKDRREALAYRLEEVLPVAAEHFSADFIFHKHEALGVCAIHEKIRPIVDAFEARNISIHTIVPAALLIAQAYSKDKQDSNANVLIWRHDDWCDVIMLDEKRQNAVGWSMLSDEPESVLLHLNMCALRNRTVRGVVLLDDQSSPGVDYSSCVPEAIGLNRVEDDPYLAGTELADQILHGQVESWIDLKDETLGGVGWVKQIGKPFKAVLVATLLLLLCVNGALLWRAGQYDKLADDYRAKERAIYEDLHPGQAPPLAINMRLAGELRKHRGMQGQSESLPDPPATLSLLHDVLGKLPTEIRLRILELRIEDDQVYLDMQSRSQPDVAAIKNALDGGGIRAEVMHADRLQGESGFGFMIVVSQEEASASAGDRKEGGA